MTGCGFAGGACGAPYATSVQVGVPLAWSATARRMSPVVVPASVKLKSSASTAALLPLADAALIQAPRSMLQIAWLRVAASQVPQAAPVEERTFAPEIASPAARPLPAPKT